jgi:hypothetical protein
MSKKVAFMDPPMVLGEEVEYPRVLVTFLPSMASALSVIEHIPLANPINVPVTATIVQILYEENKSDYHHCSFYTRKALKKLADDSKTLSVPTTLGCGSTIQLQLEYQPLGYRSSPPVAITGIQLVSPRR